MYLGENISRKNFWTEVNPAGEIFVYYGISREGATNKWEALKSKDCITATWEMKRSL